MVKRKFWFLDMETFAKTKETPKLYMLVGLPRSGKTTWRKENQWRGIVLSSDDLRYKVYGKRFLAGGEPLMWRIYYIFLITVLEQGRDIIVDSTNATRNRRKWIIESAKKHGYSICCIQLRTDAEECIRRAMIDDDKYIVPVIKRIAARFQPPEPDEGFDSMIII